MKILLEENLPRKLAGYLVGHTCRSVVECGWSGKKNSELLGLVQQQNLHSTRIAVLILRVRSKRIQDLLPFIPECLAAVESIQPWQVVRVGSFPPR